MSVRDEQQLDLLIKLEEALDDVIDARIEAHACPESSGAHEDILKTGDAFQAILKEVLTCPK